MKTGVPIFNRAYCSPVNPKKVEFYGYNFFCYIIVDLQEKKVNCNFFATINFHLIIILLLFYSQIDFIIYFYVGNKMQLCTQRYDRRPFGVGLLVGGYDENGAHIYQTCPSANFYDCKAMSIGARSQSARTYLEKHLDEVLNGSLEELIKHGLRALRDTLPPEVDLNTKNVAIGFVGKGQTFKILEEQETAPYLALIEGEERRGK